ncbi:hypothetical protein DVH24_001670 [Malus domestica]|uniref:Uncharacterized protein n=1 Tax=Malus domestica TaxID=3750 RepID=A0A498I7F5_MALDO|nr:hypothetical protein DVH24_001670 [Malus domestica]
MYLGKVKGLEEAGHRQLENYSIKGNGSGLSSCEAKRPQALYVTQLLSTCRLENPPHVQGRVESCPTSVRDKVCYVLI